MLVVRGLIDRQTVAARAVQSFRMECLDKELIAALLVKQIFNRHKQHTKWNAHRARFVKAVHQADTAVLPLLRLRLAGALHLEGRMSRMSLRMLLVALELMLPMSVLPMAVFPIIVLFMGVTKELDAQQVHDEAHHGDGKCLAKSTRVGIIKRCAASTSIESATIIKSIALVYPARACTLPVPKQKARSCARVRANQYATAASPSAPACVAMCQPSAVSASDPVA